MPEQQDNRKEAETTVEDSGLSSNAKAAASSTTLPSFFGRFLLWFRPALPAPRLPRSKIDQLYPKLRWQVFESAFVGYALFYVVRNNLSVVAKEMGDALGYNKSMVGDILAATAISYGIGKLLMGYLSDRSNPRKFLPVGLLLTAGINFMFGASGSYGVHLSLWTLNGLIQGMGYGPCARGLGYWYTYKERGRIFGVWNMSHNIGGGAVGVIAAWCASHFGWSSAFFVPGLIAATGAIYLFWRMRDRPESMGLPPIEEYRNEYPPDDKGHGQEELGFRHIFAKYILRNKALWLIAFANFFVYIARYSMLDWGPTYLKEKKGASLLEGGFSTLMIEFAGAAGMLIMGWVSDKFEGRRGMVSAVCMFPLAAAFARILFTPPGMLWLDLTLLTIIGFLVYVPVMMLGVMSLDLTSKQAVGTAAGFVGLFGYIGRVVQGKGIGYIAHHYTWDHALYAVLGCTLMAALLLLFTWNYRPRA